MNKSRIFLIPVISMGLTALSGCGKQKTFTVYWKNYDGTLLETDKNVPQGETPTYDGETPEKEWDTSTKYIFNGWDKEVGPVSADVTYTATFENKPRLYFDVYWKNYDNSILEIDKGVEEGTVPTFDGNTPTKQKTDEKIFTFKGWDKPIGPISGETVYKATYDEAPREYKISFLNYDNTVLQEKMVGYGSVPSYDGETPTRESSLTTDYEWTGGWDRELKPVDGNMIYKATFNETVHDTVKIIYKFPSLKHEVVNSNKTKVREGDSVTLTDPSCQGYDFKGFYLDEEYKKPVTALPNLEIDVVLYGKFEPHTYTITYSDEGSVSDPNPTSITCLDTFTLNNPSRVGYEFQAWKDSKGKTYTKLDDVCEDLVLTAHYIANKYHIVFVYTESDNHVVEISYDEKVVLDEVSKNGYEFLGWYYADNPDVKFELEKYNLLHDVILIPKLSDAINYDIHYELDGGENPSDAPEKYSDINHPELPTPTKQGFDFAGWEYKGKEFKSFVDLYEPIILFAKWIPHDVHITFDYDGGSLRRNVTFKNGTEVAQLSPVSPFESASFYKIDDRENAQFNGWVDNNGKRETFESDKTISADLELKAEWSSLEPKAVGSHVGDVEVFNVDGFNYQTYQFTPLVNQTVNFFSEGEIDVKASLYLKGTTEVLIAHDDISESNTNFNFSYDLVANNSYILKVESNIQGKGEATIKTSTNVESQIPTGKISGDNYQIASITQKYDETFKGIPDPVKEGKTFGGWKDEDDNLFEVGAIFTKENIALKAVWVD
jgi:hypothetical protein